MVTTRVSAGALRFVAALVGALLFGSAAEVVAADLSFTLSPQTGSGLIGFAGGTAPLVGQGIGVTSVTGLDTPLHGPSTTLGLVNGALSFTTGNFLGGSNAGTEWDFASGGVVNLWGTIPALGINTSADLLSGSFSDPTFVKSLNGGGLKVQGGAFFSIVDPTLASYFGLPTGVVLYSGGLSTLFQAAGTSPSAFSSHGFTGGTLTISPLPGPAVPEPGTLLVFGTLAAGAIVWTRQRRA